MVQEGRIILEEILNENLDLEEENDRIEKENDKLKHASALDLIRGKEVICSLQHQTIQHKWQQHWHLCKYHHTNCGSKVVLVSIFRDWDHFFL